MLVNLTGDDLHGLEQLFKCLEAGRDPAVLLNALRPTRAKLKLADRLGHDPGLEDPNDED